jgi:hypothetical protein
VRSLWVTVVILLSHQVRILFHAAAVQRAVCRLGTLVIATVAVAEGRLVAADRVHVELVRRCHVLGVHFVLRAVVGVVDGWARDPVGRAYTVLEVYDGWPRLDIIIVAGAAERDVASFLHRGLGHRTVVYIAVSIEGRLDLSVRGWVRIVVLTRVLRKSPDKLFGFLRLR